MQTNLNHAISPTFFFGLSITASYLKHHSAPEELRQLGKLLGSLPGIQPMGISSSTDNEYAISLFVTDEGSDILQRIYYAAIGIVYDEYKKAPLGIHLDRSYGVHVHGDTEGKLVEEFYPMFVLRHTEINYTVPGSQYEGAPSRKDFHRAVTKAIERYLSTN